MGAVTWIAVRAELKPTIERPLLLGAESLSPLTPFVYEVQRAGLGEHSFILNDTAAAMLLNARGGGVFDEIRRALPRYLCVQNVAGFERLPHERVDYQTTDITAIARQHGLETRPAIGPVSAMRVLAIATSPCGDQDWRQHLRGQCLSIFFLTTLDRAAALIDVFANVARDHAVGDEATGCYVQPVVQNHACHVEVFVPFAAACAGEVECMRVLEHAGVARLADAGAFFSRPYASAGETVFRQNPVSYDVLKKVKGIFDPNRVLNRGKWGL